MSRRGDGVQPCQQPKTHVMAAIRHELVRASHAVLFTRVSELVEKLLEPKRDLRLSRELQRLDRFECLALDDS
jgi:DNA replication protein DnaC